MRIFLFLLASLECLTNHTPDLLPDIHWNSLSLLLPHTNAKSLKYRWVCLRDIHVKTLNNWTEQEDQTLKSIIEETNPELLAHNFNYFNPNYKQNQKIKWSFIAMELNQRIFKTNSMIKKIPKLGKHCRERWSNHLNPFLNKNDWTEIEDLQLLELSIKYERKWTKIAKEFPERTQHSVKNRYLSLIAREYKISRKNLSQKIISCKILQQNTLFNLKNRIQKNQPILDSQLLTFYDNEVKENKKEESLSEVDQWIGINKEEFSPENSFIFENKNDFNKEMKIIGRKKSENEMDLDSEKIWFS